MLLSRTKSEVTRTPPNGFACPTSLADPTLRVGGRGRRAARRNRELSARVRLRARHLAALEAEQFEALPEGYSRTFLRCYANYLGLDGQLFVDEYNARFPLEEPIIRHPPPRRRREWGAPSVGTLVILAAVVVLL